MNPHMKNRTVMTANGPRKSWPFRVGVEIAVCSAVAPGLAICLLASCFRGLADALTQFIAGTRRHELTGSGTALE